ncbi:MAG: VWA domain-containing protein [Anaerolineae bacterium]|nr:VWA domain-containing protein [Anaerolineae bacterium]
MSKRFFLTSLVGALIFLGLALSASADGIIVPIPPPGRPMPSLHELTIKYHHVSVEIENQVATTRVDQVFVNELGYEIEGEYIFPLPEGASISAFAMWVDGQRLEAEVLERERAQEIYERIVRERRDPALLEYVGRNAFRARIYPIPAHGEKRVELEYSEVLPQEAGLVKYLYPLNTERFSARPLEQVSVSVKVASRQPLKAIYSPSHDVSVSREDERHALVGYEESHVTPSRDFALYYTVADDDLSINVISFKEAGEDGYLLLLAAPPVEVGEREVVARDIFLVLDVSGSMRGEKLAQAKRAATYVLDNLSVKDRFNIIAFSTATRHFARGPQPASAATRAQSFVKEMQAGGSTNISRALEETLAQTEAGRPQVVLFLTDGLPTEGERQVGKILARVDDLASEELSLFAFGVGYDVNTLLLDRMSQGHHGTSVYVRPGEDLDLAVSGFYEKISTPVLTRLSLDWGQAQVEEVYPYPLPDLFAGSQLVLVGRYREGGVTDLTLQARSEAGPERFSFEDIRLRERGGAEFIPRLWATRKIGYLMSQIELHGSQRELVDEIIDLSVKYGIVTPYTSFLVDDTDEALSADGRRRMAERELVLREAPMASPGAGKGGAQAPMAAPSYSGEAAVEKSIAQNTLREADVAAEPQIEQVRTVGQRAFVLRDGVWTDTTYDATEMRSERIPFGSRRYFELVARYPEWGRYLALGPRVLLVWEGRAYEITETDNSLPDARDQPEQQGASPDASAQPGVSSASARSAIPSPTPSPGLWDSIRAWWHDLVD